MARESVEIIKEESRQLRGTLAEELAAPTSHFDESGRQLLKFHGIYQQEDRDQRAERRRAKEEPAYQFMVRTALPGGFLTAAQYLALDDLAERYANGTLRVTTREGFQLHGVLKGNLKQTVREINDALVTTLSACGDVARNVICCPSPAGDPVRNEILALARALAAHLQPKSGAYHSIWLNGEKVEFDGEPEPEPIYGRTYLPRKFKIAVAFPGDNCVDVLANDLGFVAFASDSGEVEGYNVLAGGGLGATHNKPDTFPRLADPLAFVAPGEALEVAEAVVKAYRDHGNRENRRQARLKYLIHERGLDWFRAEVERHLGRSLTPPRPMPAFASHDHLGWHSQADGRLWLGLPVENGRIVDNERHRTRSGLRAIIERFRPDLRLTAQHNLLLTNLEPSARPEIETLLRDYSVATVETISAVRRHEMACPAMPTCGLAIAESERVAPQIVDELEQALLELGLGDATLNLRITGCPNGCARPYVSEVGIVGRSADRYTLYLAGSFDGTRLNQPYADLVPRDELVPALRPLLAYWRDEALDGERFGDFCARVGLPALHAAAARPAFVPALEG